MNQQPIFTDEDLRKLLDGLLYRSHYSKDVPTREYALALKVRDAVEAKVRATTGGPYFRNGRWYGYPKPPQPAWTHDEGWP